jgi:hypothetical protein
MASDPGHSKKTEHLVTPVQASSASPPDHHRLNQEDHRQAYVALYQTDIVCMRFYQTLIDYVARRIADSRTKRENIRCLKCFLIREIDQRVMTDFPCAKPQPESPKYVHLLAAILDRAWSQRHHFKHRMVSSIPDPRVLLTSIRSGGDPMKRTVLIVLGFGALTFSSTVHAQTDAQLIEQSLAAAPQRGRDDATVVKWAADHTYMTIKEGTNKIVCYSRVNERDRPAFAAQCTNLANLERVAQNRQFRAESTDREGERALVAAAAENGTRVPAEYGSWFRSMNGPDQEGAMVHTTIAMPGATTASAGFPENREQGGAFIMAAGTTESHLMLP